MNDIERSVGIRNATAFTILSGGFLIFLGYQSYQISLISPGVYPFSFEAIILLFGVVTLCASLSVWHQKSWNTKAIAIIGIAACVTLIISGFYLVALPLAVMYWIAISQINKSFIDQNDSIYDF